MEKRAMPKFMLKNGLIIQLNMVLVIYFQMVPLEFTSMTQQKLLQIKAESNIFLLNLRNFEYIEKKPGDKADSLRAYKMADYPQERELTKKVTLLQHFRNYLYADTKLDNDKDSNF